MRFRPLPVMTGLTIVSLVILVLLGNWQYQRYTEKRSSTPENLPPVVSVTGTVLEMPGAEIQQVYGIADGEPIWRRYLPVAVDETNETVLFMADVTGGPRPVAAPVPGGMRVQADARMFARESRPSSRNRPEDNNWFVFDLPGILLNYGLEDVARVAEPVEITIRNADDLARTRITANPYGAPQPIDDLPPERHFGYAITWWGLAAALFVMYFVFHASQGRFSLKGK